MVRNLRKGSIFLNILFAVTGQGQGHIGTITHTIMGNTFTHRPANQPSIRASDHQPTS